MSDPLPIVLTGGDPAGIGPELINHLPSELRRLADSGRADDRRSTSLTRLLYFATAGPEHIAEFQRACQSAGLKSEIRNDPPTRESWRSSDVIVIPSKIGAPDRSVLAGQPSTLGGGRAFGALKAACDFLRAESAAGLLTAPVAKDRIADWLREQGSTLDFRGHTDYLADRFDARVFMVMHGARFSVVPVTVHVPLMQTSELLRRSLMSAEFIERLEHLRRIPEFAASRWVMCGLNPHAGENGLLGTEERDFMAERLSELRRLGYPIDGPLPADAVFLADVLPRYRLVFGCYHDQVLIPFKALEGREGVNWTVGLPFPRVSPDHGTAFDIAGQSVADPAGMLAALRLLARESARLGEQRDR